MIKNIDSCFPETTVHCLQKQILNGCSVNTSTPCLMGLSRVTAHFFLKASVFRWSICDRRQRPHVQTFASARPLRDRGSPEPCRQRALQDVTQRCNNSPVAASPGTPPKRAANEGGAHPDPTTPTARLKMLSSLAERLPYASGENVSPSCLSTYRAGCWEVCMLQYKCMHPRHSYNKIKLFC